MLREPSGAQLSFPLSQDETPDVLDPIETSRIVEQREFDDEYDRLDRKGINSPGDIRAQLANRGFSNWGAVMLPKNSTDRHKSPAALK